MTLKDAKELFLTHCQYEKNLSPKTIEAYDLDVRQFALFLRDECVDDITLIAKGEIRDYLKSINHYEIKTIKRKMASMKALFNFLEFEDEITISPFRKLKLSLKEPQQLPVLMNQEEVKKILHEAYEDFSKHIPDSSSAIQVLRDVAVLELLFATGMRVSELCNLHIRDFDLATGSILVLGKGRKQRLIQVCNESVMQLIRVYRSKIETADEIPESFFINRLRKPLSDQSVRLMIKKYYVRAGITKHITPHSFRHTFATLLLEEDVDIRYIQHLLGHSSIAVTQIYTHVNQEKQRQILSDKHPRSKFEMGIGKQ